MSLSSKSVSKEENENSIPNVANKALRAGFENAKLHGVVVYVQNGHVVKREKTGQVVMLKSLPKQNTALSKQALSSGVLKRKRNATSNEEVSLV